MRIGLGQKSNHICVSRITLLYALSHFMVDFACAFLVLRFVQRDRYGYTALLFYNFCAFALQMPLGLLLDSVGKGKVFASAGCLVIAASFLFRTESVLLCIAAGVGNALFHIGGGHDVLRLSGRKAGWLGVFVSPGAFGLFLGGRLAGRAAPEWPVLIVLLLFAALMLFFCPIVAGTKTVSTVIKNRKSYLSSIVLLFLVVCLRSYGGFMFQFPWKKGIWAWILILSVVFGKTVGGWLYDRMGDIRAAAISLGCAGVLFIGSANAVLGCVAVMLFNITMPVTLRVMADELPKKPAFSFGLLTFALFVGYLPVWLNWPGLSGRAAYAGLCLVSLVLLLPVMMRRSL